MKIYYHKDENGNVGDDLNEFIWENFLPKTFDGFYFHTPKQNKTKCTDSLLIGIGTLLDQNIPKGVQKAIFSSGIGYGSTPDLDSSWKIYCVRGPLTAKKLNISSDKAITDAAILCSKLTIPTTETTYRYSFIPHITTHLHQSWQNICTELNIHYLPPNLSPEQFLIELRESDIVICEAMHGAILSDSLRIPWVPVTTHKGILEFKWQDWCASLNLEYNPITLPSLWKTNSKIKKFTLNYPKYLTAKNILKKITLNTPALLSNSETFKKKVNLLEGALNDLHNDIKIGKFD